MKFKAYIYIFTSKSKLLKPYIIDKVLDKTHAESVLKKSLTGKKIRILTINKID